MQPIACRRPRVSQRIAIAQSLLFLTVFLWLPGCDPGGSSGSLTPQATPSAQVEQQAITSLLDLYRQAIVQEDIDRLHALRQPAPALRAAAGAPHQASDGTFAALEAFRQLWSDTLRRLAITAVVQQVAETGTTRFFAVTVAADGTVWAGGDAGARLYRVTAGESSATLHGHLLAAPEGRIEDLTLDARGRLHAVVFSPQASGVVVLDQGGDVRR